MNIKYLITLLLVLLLGGVLSWYFFVRETKSEIPYNPPTAEELERIDNIEQSSSQVAPNAVPGAGVRPKGSLPRTPEPTATTSTETASSTASTSDMITPAE